MKPLVSIVIPTFNRASDLHRALSSVRAQTYSKWEVLVVDNHSKDNTDEVVRSFADARIGILKIHNNGIIATSRNLGVRQSRGEIIAFLDSDDWWVPQKLHESVRCLEQGNQLVYHDLYLVKKPNQVVLWRKCRTRNLHSSVLEDLISNGNPISNSSVVVKKILLDEIGGFSECQALAGAEDYDAWLRISRITEGFKRIPKALGFYWMGGATFTTPKRSISTIEFLEERYAQEFYELNMRGSCWWTNYVKGVAHYQLKSYEKARKHFALVPCWQAPYTVMIKSIWLWILASLIRNKSSNNQVGK